MTLPKEQFTPSKAPSKAHPTLGHPGTHPILGPYGEKGSASPPAPVPTTINGIEPEIYGPFSPEEAKKKAAKDKKSKDSNESKDAKKSKEKIDTNTEKPLIDDGTHRSDTATKTHSIYFYQPFASLPFPENDEAPQPFLNDFKPFQK